MTCPDPDQLLGAMTPDARAAWLDHAAGCEACHAVLQVLEPEAIPTAEATRREPPPPATIDRFVLGEVLGRGASGLVYAATDPALDRRVAVKVLHASVRADRLRREAQALARLNHPNVVQIYDVGEHDGRGFVAMELIDGDNLRGWLRTRRTQAQILAVLEHAGRGLIAAHAAGLIHRDFKPDNVLIARDGRVLVGDFGLARTIGSQLATEDGPPPATALAATSVPLTMTGSIVGTPAYMAPEQSIGEPTPASDQYAFCVTAWEALFGQRPIEGATLGELRDNARAGRILTVDGIAVPRHVEAALRRGLEPRAIDRFPSMVALLAALAPARRRRWPRVLFATAATLAIVSAIAVAGRPRSPMAAPCDHAADPILATWTPERARTARAQWGEAATAAFERWTRTWRRGRIAACYAAADQRPDDRTFTDRLACYERARGTFITTIAGLGSPPPMSPARALTAAATLPALAACEGTAVTAADYTSSDPRGCNCPFSACSDDRVCGSQCRAAAFRSGAPVLGVNQPRRQEALAGASLDGTTLLYLAGDGVPDPTATDLAGCRLRHLFVARQAGDRFIPVELNAQLPRDQVRLGEGCCAIAPDGRSLLVWSPDRRGFVRFGLVGDRLTAGSDREFAQLRATLPAGYTIANPVLSADERTLLYQVIDGAGDGSDNGTYASTRGDRAQPFPRGERLEGRARSYEYPTGISADGLTLFMAFEFETRVLYRASIDEPFGGVGVPPALPGWRARPILDCGRLVMTSSPGGCEQEDLVYFDAVGR